MKHVLIALFSLIVGSSSAFFLFQGNGEELPETKTPEHLTQDENIFVYSPSLLEGIRSVTVPAVQTSLLSDTDRETDLLVSLNANPAIRESSAIESVHCLEKRCQVLVEPKSEFVKTAFVEHIEAHPQFGRDLRIATGGDKENKSLLTFIFTVDTQVSTNR